MPQLQPSEIFLISLVIGLWLISILVCLRRYSLFLCFHKRDVPFYNINLINDSNKNPAGTGSGSNPSEKSRPLSPISSNQRTCTYLNLNQSNLASENPSQFISIDQKLDQASVNFYCNKCNSYSRQLHQQPYHQQRDSFISVSNGSFSNYSNGRFANKPLTSWFQKKQSIDNKSSIQMLDKTRYDESSEPFFKSSFPNNKVYIATHTNRTNMNRLHITSKPCGAMQSTYANDKLSQKRSVIRNKHFNLMSLDENALNLYRQHSAKYNHQSQQLRNQNLTIPEHNEIAPNTRPVNQHHNIPKLSHLVTSSNTPHANFISLRSGSDSVNSSWVKPAHSCDSNTNNINNLEYSNELFTSSSLQQSQFLQLPPSLLNIHNYSSNTPNSSKSNLIQQQQQQQQQQVSQKTPEPAPLPTSQRPINPISNLRRHMFVNSKRNAQTTTIDCSSNLVKPNDSSFNLEQSYDFAASVSFASTNQLVHSPNMNKEPLPSIMSSRQDFETSTAAKTADTKVEVINECADPNLLNPSWIPPIVRQTLLEMHERAVKSKSDSNIKAKYRSSNHLLHSPTYNKNKCANSRDQSAKFAYQSNRKKKPLSLQNSQDKSTFYSITPVNNGTPNRSYLNNFYDELKQKLFPNANSNSNSNTNTGSNASNNNNNTSNINNSANNFTANNNNKSGSISNTMSTNVSTGFKQDSSSKQNSQQQSPSSSLENDSSENLKNIP